jgi:hypothetical protein
MQPVLPIFLWLLHLGILLYFIYDNSPQQQRTRRMIDGILDLVSQLVRLSSLPLVKSIVQPIQAKVIGLLREAGLVPATNGFEAAPMGNEQ